MITTISQPFTVGRCAMPRFVRALDQAELVTGCRLEMLDVHHRLFSVKLIVRATGSAQTILAAGRVIDQVIGR